MFDLTRENLKHLSKRTGFIQNSLEKVIRIIQMLGKIRDHPFLQTCFALKGGTALNLFIYNLPRLSVDIDLNYVKSIDRNQMGEDRQEISGMIYSLFSADYVVKNSMEEYALSQYEFSYNSVSGSQDKIKIDINYLHRLPMIPIKNNLFTGFDLSLSFPILGLEELLAGKVSALISRYTPRDLFDIYQTVILKPNLDRELFRSLILYYGLVSRRSIFELFELNLERVSNYDIRRILYPLLMRGMYPEGEKIRTSTEKFLKPFLLLTSEESEAITNFYTTGNLDMDILFPQKELQNKIQRSPRLLWKVHNIKQHVRDKKRVSQADTFDLA